jgi:hypothetical protein
MSLTLTKQPSAPSIDAGTYVLELTSVREVEVDDFDHPGQKADRVEVTFTIRDHPRWQDATFTDLATPRLGPRAKLGQIMTALNGGLALPDGEVDLETFLGRRLQATIRRKDNGYNQIIAETAVPLAAVAAP